ncbi:MAG: transcription antitermination factor NusB [Lachnospiraceae bacterium]|nr:transcription antitermination factor NusB [Lachnospiraceae bacterium]
MTRREIREQIFLKLFQIEFHPEEDLTEQLRYLDNEEEMEETKDTEYIQNKINAIAAKVTEIDAAINEVAKGWKTTRMGKVDLTLIRLAVYEIRYEESIPTGVAINEAVELAKKYGTEESPSFINGILAKIA